jgi:conjugative transfer region protein (TIGR03748 family)
MLPSNRTLIFRRLALLTLVMLATGCATPKRPPSTPSAARVDPLAGVPGAVASPVRRPAVYENSGAATPPDRTRTGRYSYLANGATAAQIDPLLAIIEVRLPHSLTTIEEAADYLMHRSGYCLMEPDSTEVRHLLRLPIPDVHRRLGPMTLREALLALGGKAYALVVDEVHREIGYRVIPNGTVLSEGAL